VRAERWTLLERIDRSLEPVFVVLSGVWIALVVAELALGGLPRSLEVLVWVIWGMFILQFAGGLVLAPDRLRYLRTHWLTALSLVLPALRILRIASAFRFLRAARVVRSVGLLRVLSSVNRGLGALGQTARRRGVGYVVAATALVMLVGAAGMASFESPRALAEQGLPGTNALTDFGDALWWTAYAMTTGVPTTPASGEGRLLGWLLSLYGLAIFGYLTAILASHFIGRDRADASAVEPR
jgi:voltage-gated potassium channel